MAQFLVRSTDDLANKLSHAAKRLGMTRNALILQILWDWAKKQTS